MRSKPLTAIFAPISMGGAAGLPWLALAAGLRLRWHDGKRLRLPVVVVSTLSGWATAKTLKLLWHRERPCQSDKSQALGRCPDSSSFPSDRSASAFAGASAIATAVPELTIPLYALAVLTAYSRIYARAHYPSDTAAGAVIGITVARVVLKGGTPTSRSRRARGR